MKERTRNNSIAISLACNVFLVIGKAIIGLLANSNALLADAIHSMTDVSAFVINHRACKQCALYRRIGTHAATKQTSKRIVQTEIRATYYTGLLLLTIGMAICMHNCMILVLGKIDKPDSIAVIVAFIALAVYVWLYKYLGGADARLVKDCILTSRNAHWQNRMNLASGVVVVIGLSASMLGCIVMDELAAVVVGSILVAMGLKLIMDIKTDLSAGLKQYRMAALFGTIVISIALAAMSLAIQL